MTDNLKTEMKSILSYLDLLLEDLPETKIKEFAQSEYFVRYQRLLKELGLGA
jgi:pilus assembly protein FimV